MVTIKHYTFATLTPQQAQNVVAWHYEPPFENYNVPAHLRHLVAQRYSDPRYLTFGIFDATGFLAACCVFGNDARSPGLDYGPNPQADANILDGGFWLNPALVHRGVGYRILIAMLAFGRQQWHPRQFRASISEDNIEVQRLVMRAGFKPSAHGLNTANKRPYVIMLMDA